MRCQYCTDENSDMDDQQPAQRILDNDKYNCPMLSDDDDPYAAAREEAIGGNNGPATDAIASTSFHHLPKSIPITTMATTTKSLKSLSPCTETTEKSTADGSSAVIAATDNDAAIDDGSRLPVINIETDERPLVEF